MTPLQLDSRLTFDTYVVGASNRLACAAARRVAEAPGATYNPLFIYSGSGLGKTHLLMAIGHYVRETRPSVPLAYHTLEQFMEEVTAAIEAGERDVFRTRLDEVGLLLLDDVQFLEGQHRTQEELLRAWDALLGRGGQVVLASDRPPPEIDGLDDRLLSRFSGGLIVDIGAPDYEMRVAILRRKAEARGHEMAPGVVEAVARTPFRNVRELQGALNRIIAVQELEGRTVQADEVAGVVDELGEPRDGGEFQDFLAEITGTLSEVVAGPLPAPPDGPGFDALPLADELFAVRAAAAVAEAPGERYNPLFVHGPEGAGKTALLAALGNEMLRRTPDAPVAYLTGTDFAEELIEALERNRVEGWRERYRRARVLILDDVDALEDTERAQEELFHLFDVLHREGAQLVFSARRPPQELSGIEERLRTRLESGLVVELPAPAPAEEAPDDASPGDDASAARAAADTAGAPAGIDEVLERLKAGAEARDDWFRSREKVVWDWPYPEEWLAEELG